MFDILLVLSAASSAYFVSNLNAYTREIGDGGVANRIWSFLGQVMFLGFAFSPLTQFFPEQSLRLNIIYYPLAGLIGGINYLATICHQNQLKRNQHREDEVRKLPFKLHNHKMFNRVILWLSKYIRHGILALYGISLIAGLFLGASLFVTSAVGMLLVDICRQRGWFPAFLQKPYLLLGLFLVTGQVLGFGSLLTIGISLGFVAYSIWDYIQIHVKGVRSSTSVFPIATPSHQLTPEQSNEPNAANVEKLQHALAIVRPRTIRITFNHFPEAIAISDRLLADAPVVDFTQYEQLFQRLQFTSIRCKTRISTEMAVHDKFHEDPYDVHAASLGIPAGTTEMDVQIAFLKREMSYLVQRLQHPSYRDLNHEEITTLQNQARRLLTLLNNIQDQNTHQEILLSLATRTGSHCNRVYLDTFAELNQRYTFATQPTLSLREQAIFTAQQIREDCFRKYYYQFMRQLKQINPLYQWIFQDSNDYHSYESFANGFGTGFCLRNKSLNVNFRSPIDALLEIVNHKLYSHMGRVERIKTLFSDYYNASRLITEVLEGKLSHIFRTWCETNYPGSYQDRVLDESSMVKKEHGDVIALAKLMLLDFKMVEFTEAYQPPSAPAQGEQPNEPSVTQGLFPPPPGSQTDLHAALVPLATPAYDTTR
jgi:hypothetical protein